MSMLLSVFLLQAAAAAPPATAEVTVAASDDSKVVCKTVNTTGSRLGGKRVCATKREWRLMNKEAEDLARSYQDSQSKRPGNQ